MERRKKKTGLIIIKMTMPKEDLECFRHCADMLWPGAVLSKSGMVLGLARMAAKMCQDREKAKARKKRPAGGGNVPER
jgi:hypothetical protein